MQISMFSLAELPANLSASPAFEKEWQTRVATSCSPIWRLLTDIGPAGWSGRTSPVSCRQTEDGLLEPSSEGWQNSGMGSPTEFLTLSTSEFHSGAVVCLLSDILETGDVPRRFYLSATACKGILRRAAKRGRQLPQQLERALAASAIDNGRDHSSNISPTILKGGDGGYGQGLSIAKTLTRRSDGSPGGGGGGFEIVPTCAAVRRLTPRECERLQGFHDDYTLITYRGKPAADGPRYKALGNSMAVPVMRWIGERILSTDRE